jgi:hypothetical protein
MLISKSTITSYIKTSVIYAMTGDKVSLISLMDNVGIYRNLETGKTFPAKPDLMQEIPDDVNLPQERYQPKEKKQKEKPPTNQISMF